MRTDDLIAAMAADAAPRPQAAALVAQWFLPVLALAGTTALTVLGTRADLPAAMSDPVTALKPLLPLLVALAAMTAVLRRSRPGEAAGRLTWPIIAVAALAGLWLVSTMLGTPPVEWWSVIRGQTLFFCLMAIPVIAALPLAALILALRAGASTAPMRSGALAGLAAGAGAASLYALHCTEDSPLFFLCWYSLGILIVTAAGALAGRRWLRW